MLRLRIHLSPAYIVVLRRRGKQGHLLPSGYIPAAAEVAAESRVDDERRICVRPENLKADLCGSAK